jgi:hypothetical protein
MPSFSPFCRICSSSEQSVIDHRLRAGESLAVLSADYAMPTPELRHHRDVHVLGLGRSPRRRRGRGAPLIH